MPVDLPGAVRRGLRGHLPRLTSPVSPPVTLKTKDAWVGRLIHWCDQQDIDLSQACIADRLQLDHALLQRIDQALEQLGWQKLAFDPRGLSRIEQMQQGAGEHKQAGASPRERRVLMRAHPGLLPGFSSAPLACQLALDWDGPSLPLNEGPGRLVAVENLDCFYAVDPAQLKQADQPAPWVIYRGDQQYRRGSSQLIKRALAAGWFCGYWGDFDLAGVQLALSEGYSHLLLPSLEWLQAKAQRGYLDERQEAVRPFLITYSQGLSAAHPLTPYLSLLLQDWRGLKQQRMVDQPCVWLALPR